MSYANGPKIVTDGLVLCLDAANRKSYPLSGSTIYDLSGNGNNGTITGAVFDTTNNGSLVFNGDDQVVVSNFTGHQTNTGTLEWIIKTPSSYLANNNYFGGVGGTTTYGASRTMRIYGNALGFPNYGSSTQDWNVVFSFAFNTWYHVVYIWNGTSLAAYFNLQFYSTTRSGVITPTGTVLSLGRPPWSAGNYLTGNVALCRLYNKCLTANEVQQNYNALKGRYGLT